MIKLSGRKACSRREEPDGLDLIELASVVQALQDLVNSVERLRDETIGGCLSRRWATEEELHDGCTGAVADGDGTGECDEITRSDVVLCAAAPACPSPDSSSRATAGARANLRPSGAGSLLRAATSNKTMAATSSSGRLRTRLLNVLTAWPRRSSFSLGLRLSLSVSLSVSLSLSLLAKILLL